MSMFGASQGLLLYFHVRAQPATAPWFTTKACYGRLGLMMIGGYIVGGTIGYLAFKEPALQRLDKSHDADVAPRFEDLPLVVRLR